MDRQISLDEIKEISKFTYVLIDREKINSLSDLEKMASTRLDVVGRYRHLFVFDLEASERGKIVKVVFEYVHPNKGVPLRIEIDSALNYTKITLKSRDRVFGYYPFSRDAYGNLIQSIKTNKSSIDDLKEELKKIFS
ncbi:MAG: hypothetical protein KatS3mg001_037 [Candidatus Pacearchaeota archaeon]|nr:MAG: hypothetical protein KatS3mg001_037 [Candidatus Pacearchaeota archaeon]